jgi:uncharacterized protein YggE
MDYEKRREKMKKIIFPTAWVLTVALAGYALWTSRLSHRAVSATGVCNASVARDKLAVSIQIRALNKNASASLGSAQTAADEVVRRIRKIDDKSLEIQTQNISSYEKTKWQNNSSVPVGIESQIDLDITTTVRDTLDAVLAAISDVPGAEVFPQNMRNFSSRELVDAATEKCLRIAILDARDKAAAIAAADGEKLGRLVSAQFGTDGDGPSPRPFMLKAARMERSSADYIQSGDSEITIRVDATFGIK